METRTRTAPKYHSWTLITDQNFFDYARQAARALGIDEYELKDLFAAEGASEKLLEDLQTSINAINQTAEMQIQQAVAIKEDHTEIAAFITTQHERLEQVLSALNEHMERKGNALLKAQNTRVEDFQNKIRGGRDCYYGNYGYRLDVLKKNLIVALHLAAKQYVETHQGVIARKPYIFNEIFYGVAHINNNGELEYDLFDIRNPEIDINKLASTEQLAAGVLARCVKENETDLLALIRAELNQLATMPCANTKDGTRFFTVSDSKPYLQFTATAYEAEKYAAIAATTAQEQMRQLKRSEAESKADFKDDRFVSEQQHILRKAALQAKHDISTFRDIITFRDEVAATLDKSTIRIDELFTQISLQKENHQANIDEIVYDNRVKSKEALAESYYLDNERRERIINKLDGALTECYAAIHYENELDALLKQRSALEQEISTLNSAAASLVEQAKAQQPPLKYPESDESGLLIRIKEHKNRVNTIANALDKLNARVQLVEPEFALDRLDLVQALPKADLDCNEYLLQRSKVTIRDIGKRPDALPAETPSFWQRHPTLKGVLIGAAIGLGIAAATVAIITPIGLVATAVAAIGVGLTVGAIVGGSALLTGIGSLIGGLIGKFKGHKSDPATGPEPGQRPQLSTEANLRRKMDDQDPAPKPAKVVKFAAVAESRKEENLSETSKAARALRDQAARNLKLTQNALTRAQRLAGKGKEEDHDVTARTGHGI